MTGAGARVGSARGRGWCAVPLSGPVVRCVAVFDRRVRRCLVQHAAVFDQQAAIKQLVRHFSADLRAFLRHRLLQTAVRFRNDDCFGLQKRSGFLAPGRLWENCGAKISFGRSAADRRVGLRSRVEGACAGVRVAGGPVPPGAPSGGRIQEAKPVEQLEAPSLVDRRSSALVCKGRGGAVRQLAERVRRPVGSIFARAEARPSLCRAVRKLFPG